MTDYLKKSFSVAAPGTDEYREGWDRIFGPELTRTDDGDWKCSKHGLTDVVELVFEVICGQCVDEH